MKLVLKTKEKSQMLFHNRILAFFAVFFAALMLFAPVSCGGNDSSPRCRNLENGRCWQCHGDACGEVASSRCGPDGICDYVPPGTSDNGGGRNPIDRACGDGFCDRDIDEEFDCPKDCEDEGEDGDYPREGEAEAEAEPKEGEGEEGEGEEKEGEGEEEECLPCEPCVWAGGDPYTNCINSCKYGCPGSSDVCENWRTCFDNCERWAYDGDPRCAGPCCPGQSCDDCQCCDNGNCGFCNR